MKADLNQLLIPLRKEQLMRLVDAEGQAVAVFSGEVWLTQEGDPEDHVLAAGEVFELDRSGLTVLHAFEDSTLAIVDPHPRLAA